MNQARIGLLIMAATFAVPSYALAQKKGGRRPAATKTAPPPAADPAPAPAPAASGQEMDADAPPGSAPAVAAPATPDASPAVPAGPVPEGGALGDICQIDPSACPTVNLAEASKRPLHEQVYAVQQIYALRNHRFEFQPAWTTSFNDQFVNHPGPTLALNYYVSNVLAIGVNGTYYFNNDSKFNAETRRAARVAVPLTEYLWSAALNFTYVPMYGKFAGFGDFIFHYDAYLVGGVGGITTRPIAVVDPDNRVFKWETPKVAFNAGLGLRIFFNRWFAGVLEVRDYIFNDKLENLSDAPGSPAYGQNKLTNNVQAQLGVSVFLPFSWDYRLPK